VFGCTDMNAINYNSEANIDDGTCLYPSPCDEFDGLVFAPNTFSPNNDGLNDRWGIVTEDDCWNTWEVIIYNRWGDIVYKMDNPSDRWDGSVNGSNHYVSDGLYAFLLKGVSWNLEVVQTNGHITVLR
jgi:gliding motility-associated-like protein